MAKWKLTRQQFGAEEFTLSEGDTVTVGRGNNNKITLSSAVISRNHCVIHVHNNRALLTDLQVPATLFLYHKCYFNKFMFVMQKDPLFEFKIRSIH